MEFAKFIEWAFYGLISSTAIYMASTIAQMKKSIEELNINFSVEIERLSNVRITIEKHERFIEKLSDKIVDIEKKCTYCKN